MSDGIITSPYYPLPYPDDTDCEYSISLPFGSYVNISLTELLITDDFIVTDTNEVVKFCKDYVEIRDGKSKDSPLMGKFCGENIPPSIQSTQNFMWIK